MGRTLPICGPWDLEKFRARPLIYGSGGGRGGSQFPDSGVPQRKDMKHVKTGKNGNQSQRAETGSEVLNSDLAESCTQVGCRNGF